MHTAVEMTMLQMRGQTPAPRATLAELALWLTAAETDLLVSLCLASPVDGGPCEHALFAKLGELARAFAENRQAA